MTIRRPALLAGKKVYRQGSYAPTQGQVDPKGYIDRERKNRLQKQAQERMARLSGWQSPWQTAAQKNQGNDGQSDRRSGLAKDALDRSRQQDPRDGKATTPGFVDDPKATAPGFVNKGSQQFPLNPPTMKINKNGQLDLPYDDAWGWDMLNAKEDLNSRLLELQQAQQGQALDFAKMKRNAGQEFTELKRDTLNNAAGRGMAYSSGYGHDVAENSNAFNTYMNDLEQRNTLFNQGIGASRSAIENAFNDFLRRSAYQRSLDLMDDAGDLGYGQDPVEPSYPGGNPNNGGSPNPQQPNDGGRNSGGDGNGKTGAGLPAVGPNVRKNALLEALRREVIERRFGGDFGDLSKKERNIAGNIAERRYEKTGPAAKNYGDDVQKRYANTATRIKKRNKKRKKGK